MRTIPDGTVSGGICRGINAVDLQSDRLINTQVASGNWSVVGGGQNNRAIGPDSFIGGGRTNLAVGFYSTVAGGERNQATGIHSTVGGGKGNGASGENSAIVGGSTNVASGVESFVGGGERNRAIGDASTISGGFFNVAEAHQCAIGGGVLSVIGAAGVASFIAGRELVVNTPVTAAFGRWNLEGVAGVTGAGFTGGSTGLGPTALSASRLFMIGDGTSPGSRSNAFSVTVGGYAAAKSGFIAGGADYAEYFESESGLRIPVGTSVVLIPEVGLIRPALVGEYPLGVISSNMCLIANAGGEWHGKYQRDEDGHLILEDRVDGPTARISPKYDYSKVYIPRAYRPEWNPVGVMGQVWLRKGQPVAPGWIRMKVVDAVYDLWFIR